MAEPLVTILVPTYNRAAYLEQALKSAQAQTYSPLEILVLDDASPDNTPEVVAGFQQDARIRYVRHQKNKNIAGNWRYGIEHARGEFFAILHDDDTFEPEFIEKLIAPHLADRDLILTFCDHWAMDEKGERDPERSREATRYFYRDQLSAGEVQDFARTALVEKSIPVGASVFRKQWIELDFISLEARGSIDAWLFLQCVRTGKKAFFVKERLMNYRMHGGGMSVSMPLYMCEGHLHRLRTALSDGTLRHIHPELKQELAETLRCYSLALLEADRVGEARSAVMEACQRSPKPRALATLALVMGGPLGKRALQRFRSADK